MDVTEFTPTRDQYAWTFGGVEPVRTVRPGSALRLWSDDAFGGTLSSPDHVSAERVDLAHVNPQTGPFFVEGAEPGDTLAIHVVDLQPARDWGVSAVMPFFGGLTSTDRTAFLQDPVADTTWIYALDRAARTVTFDARFTDLQVALPLEPMDLGLTGRRALVTGGTKGIGRAIVESLVAEGAHVAFCARDAAGVAEAAEATGAHGTVLDVADADGLAAWVSAAAAELGGIDIVVSNVSALAIGPGEANWHSSFEVDLLGAVRLVEAARAHLLASGVGPVVTVSSVSGREIDFASGSYGVMKAALVHYTQGLAFELAGQGVRANTVSPGNTFFPGGVWESIQRDNTELYDTALALNPTGRIATPQEIADAVVFLASPRSSFTTGAHLVVDGALTRGVQL